MSTKAECLQADFTLTRGARQAARSHARRDLVGIGWIAAGAAYLIGMAATFTIALS